MNAYEICLIVLCSLIALLLAACLAAALCLAVQLGRRVRSDRPKKGLRAWWQTHKPTKRRLIQVYAALLFNLNIKGFVTGNIFRGGTKYLCVPGLNCYSCPGAVGACPLGALQNAFAASKTRTPVYVLGILLLYCVLFARTVCGFLCPVGLGQELLYKIKSPKVKKSRATRIFSYFKYVLLALFVVALPLAYGFGENGIALPAFCKYICPAGTLGGAIGLLIHPTNAPLYEMLGGLFTWKFVVLVAVFAACIFFYRFFCRFLCPLGALYGFFNKIALLGVKLDQNKCTECGLCVEFCKMDIRKVGDHECINCGECIPVCPAKAITWKGSALFVHENAVPAPSEARPITLAQDTNQVTGQTVPQPAEAIYTENAAPMSAVKPKRDRKLILRGVAWGLAVLLFGGAFVYCNFLYDGAAAGISAEYTLVVDSKSNHSGLFTFSLGKEGKLNMHGGSGTAEDPILLHDFTGTYEDVPINMSDSETVPVYYRAEITKDTTYTVIGASDDLSLTVYCGEDPSPVFDLAAGENTFTLYAAGMSPSGVPYGNTEGRMCYDFTVDLYGDRAPFTLSEQRGKIVIVNFWYTDCTPCVGEMPNFARIAEEYGEDVTVLAIHSAQITTSPATREGVQTWLNTTKLVGLGSMWAQSPILFGQDRGKSYSESEIYSLLGGRSGTYPHTVIVDRQGVIVYAATKSVSYDDLKAIVEKSK